MEFTELFDVVWEELIKIVFPLYKDARMSVKEGLNKTSYSVLITDNSKKKNEIFSMDVYKEKLNIYFTRGHEHNAQLIGAAIEVAVKEKFPEQEFNVWYD